MFSNAHSGSSCCLNLRGPGFNFAALVLIAALRSCCRWSEEHRAQCLFTSLKKRWNRINGEAKDHTYCSAIKRSDFQILSLEQITNKQKIEGHKQPEFITKQQKLNHVEQQYACVYIHIYRQLTARTLLHPNTSQYNKTQRPALSHEWKCWAGPGDADVAIKSSLKDKLFLTNVKTAEKERERTRKLMTDNSLCFLSLSQIHLCNLAQTALIH